jgi:hypothetical protein
MLSDMIGFIAVDAFDESDGRGLLWDIVTHMSGARSSPGDGVRLAAGVAEGGSRRGYIFVLRRQGSVGWT